MGFGGASPARQEAATMANERTPQQIIGDDAFNQLAFEGYVVTRPAAPVEGMIDATGSYYIEDKTRDRVVWHSMLNASQLGEQSE